MFLLTALNFLLALFRLKMLLAFSLHLFPFILLVMLLEALHLLLTYLLLRQGYRKVPLRPLDLLSLLLFSVHKT